MSNFDVFSLVGLACFVLLAMYVYYVAQQRARGYSARYSTLLIAGLLIAGLLLQLLGIGLIFVQPQERAIILSVLSNTGYRAEALRPGAHLIFPGLESAIRVPIGQQAYTMSRSHNEGQVKGDDSVSARTSDGQEVFIDATVQYQIDDTKVPDMYIKWQNRYADDFVRPQSRSIIYNAVSQYKVEEVYSTKRTEIQKRIEEDLRVVFMRDGIRLTAFLMRNVTFSPEYAKSVEEKQIAQQNAERAKFVVQGEEQEAARVRVKAKGEADAVVTRSQADADAQVIRAKAEAESLRLVSQALKDNPDLLTLRYIEKLAPTVQTVLLPSNQGMILDTKQLLNPPKITSGTVITR